MGQGLSLAVSIAVPLFGGMIGGFSTQKDVATWYPGIKKPRWTPPSFLFAPVWSVLYIAQGTASWLVWRKKGPHRAVALGLYGAQLLLNLIWNPLFFKTHKTDVALADITALLGLATAATVKMSQATSPGVQLPLMLPYLAWVSYATALTANIWATNPTERLIKPKSQKEAEAKDDAAKKTSPVRAAQETVTAAKAGVAAAKAAAQTYQAGYEAVQHAGAAVQPLVAAKDAVTGATTAVKEAVGGLVGAGGSAAPEPAGVGPTASAIHQEVQQGLKKQQAVAPAAAAAAPEGGSGRTAAEAIEEEIKQAVGASST